MNDSSSSQHRPRRPVPAPSNPVIINAQKQWYFTDEELLRTPSLLDGMSMETEHMQRSKGVNFIMQVGIMLKLPQLTLTTAAVFMHRFFVRFSMVDQPRRPGMHPYSVAAGCLFLASKVDENCRKIREVVIACCRVAQKNPDLEVDEQSKEFWKWKDTLLAYEDMCLEALCFDLQLEQPHKVCYDFLVYFGKNDHKHLRNAAWAFLNDSNFTVLCLQFYPRTIAAAALWAGARLCNVAFEDDEEGRPWWEQIDVNLADVRRAVSRMTQLYENNPVHKQAHQYPTNSADSDGAAETTRIVNLHPIVTTPPPAATPNGRKRSRENEEDSNAGFSTSRNEESSSQLRVNNNNTTTTTTTTTTSREPSPKRLRRTPELASPNGHRPSSRIPAAARDDQHRRQHPLPRVPPVPASSDSRNGNSVDPVQQRIDEIVHQGLKNGNGNRDYTNNNNNYNADRDRDRDRDWDRDRERYRDRDRDRDRDTRRRSVATNTSTGSDKHQKPTRDSSEGQRKGAAAAADDDDDDDDAEEGEINSDREEGEVTSTNPTSGSAQYHGDDGGGGSEEGEV